MKKFGIIHNLIITILKEQAINGYHNGVILPFLGMKRQGEMKRRKKTRGHFCVNIRIKWTGFIRRQQQTTTRGLLTAIK